MKGAPASVFCADDFTGASDTLASLVRHGLRARLYLQPPTPSRHPELAGLDAIGVATSLRSRPRMDAMALARGIARKLAALDVSFYHLKVCSTFDSSLEVGNIAAVADVLANQVGASCTAIIGGQPSLGRYCMFGNLFARMGDRVYRIDRHPVMSVHPTTPMGESDLRLHLGRQGWEQIGLVPYTEYQSGHAPLAEAINLRLDKGECRLLFDVSRNEDLVLIGMALRKLAQKRTVLCVGASSVVEALYAPPITSNMACQPSNANPRLVAPIFAFSGSRSSVTEQQVACTTSYKKIPVTVITLQDASRRLALVQRCQNLLGQGVNVLVHLVEGDKTTLDGRTVATMTAKFIHDVLFGGIHIGCLVVAGGDTSSAAVEHLDVESISMVCDFDRGVPIVRAHAQNQLDGLQMVLKGGQMGHPCLFETLVTMTRS